MELGVGYWIGLLAVTGVVIFGWFALGPGDPVIGLAVAGWTYAFGPGIAVPVMRLIPSHWFRIPARERILHRILGVGIFASLLERSGWSRRFGLLKVPRAKTDLPHMELSVRACFSAKAACFAMHLLLAGIALFTGHAWGALWILLPGVFIHLYPALLQRSILLRLQPMLTRGGAPVGPAVSDTSREIESALDAGGIEQAGR